MEGCLQGDQVVQGGCCWAGGAGEGGWEEPRQVLLALHRDSGSKG